MSITLDAILAQAANGDPATVTFSSESVTVLLFAMTFIQRPFAWLDREEDPLDDVTEADWDEIETLIGNATRELMTGLVGMIFPIMTATPPTNALLCDGSMYAREDYPVLYATIDPAFIVDADNFVVPDLRSKVALGAGQGAGLSAYVVGQTGGEEAHALTEDENGTHGHEPIPHQHLVGAGVSILAIAPGEAPVQTPNIPGTDLTGFASAEVMPSGLGQAHNNIQPYIALNWAVVAY